MSSYEGQAVLIQGEATIEVKVVCFQTVDPRSDLGSWWGSASATNLAHLTDPGEAQLQVGDRVGDVILRAKNTPVTRPPGGAWYHPNDTITFMGSGQEPF